MSDSSEPGGRGTKPGGAPAGGCLKWFALTLVAALIIAGIVLWKFVDETAGLAKRGTDWLAGLGGALETRTITETFEDAVTRIASSQGDILELATVEARETLSRYDMRSAFNDIVYLGTTVSEIQVPVVYRYHLRLSDEWSIDLQDGVCRVEAPQIRPTLPPAIRTDGMQKKSKAGWLRFNAAENLAQLEKEITPKIEKRAGDARHIDLAREASREAVREFVRKWVLDEHPGLGEVEIRVTFPDEESGTPESTAAPPA